MASIRLREIVLLIIGSLGLMLSTVILYTGLSLERIKVEYTTINPLVSSDIGVGEKWFRVDRIGQEVKVYNMSSGESLSYIRLKMVSKVYTPDIILKSIEVIYHGPGINNHTKYSLDGTIDGVVTQGVYTYIILRLDEELELRRGYYLINITLAGSRLSTYNIPLLVGINVSDKHMAVDSIFYKGEESNVTITKRYTYTLVPTKLLASATLLPSIASIIYVVIRAYNRSRVQRIQH